MIVISMLLVVVGFVSLMLGVLNVGVGDLEPLSFVYGAIAACLLAGLFLIAGVVRSRPRHRPVGTPAGDGHQASWSGAAPRQPERPASHVKPAAPGMRTDTGAVDAAAPEQSPEDADATAAAGPPAAAAGEAGASAAAAGEVGPSAEAAGGAGAPAEAAGEAGAPATAAGEVGPPASADVEARLRAVSGVGPAKRRALLEHFGTHAAVASATVEELAAVRGVSPTLAQRIHDSLHA